MIFPNFTRIGTGGGGTDPQTATNTTAIAANTATVTMAATDVAALQTAVSSINSDNATQTELDALAAAQTVLDTAQDGTITANQTDIATLTAGLAAVNADNLTQTESDALQAALTAAQAAQDTLIASNTAAIASILATIGESVPVGAGVMAVDTRRIYVNNTAAAITLTGDTGAALLGDGLELDAGAPPTGEVVYKNNGDTADAEAANVVENGGTLTAPAFTAGLWYVVYTLNAAGDEYDGKEVFTLNEAGDAWLADPAATTSATTVDAYNTLAELPDPTALLVGTQASVVNDPTPANNRVYLAGGASVGSNATAWV